ncbi:hypothetical protein B5M43_013035 [Microbacterium sp. MEC084]|uniref:hypothetical protein n=1 Tax=Microbacterium sp. MEC084 TaxID=1963027 RepID=UPI00106F1E07|nr:hypothetical protein [Microbacterium sp. MEC084]MCD1269750.1 hypothetical protein [Microbacterium sp. MEC084]
MAPQSAWRSNDIVAYYALRDVADVATAAVLRLAAGGAISRDKAVAEVSVIRHELFDVDAFDRSTLDTLIDRLAHRIAEFSGPRP